MCLSLGLPLLFVAGFARLRMLVVVAVISRSWVNIGRGCCFEFCELNSYISDEVLVEIPSLELLEVVDSPVEDRTINSQQSSGTFLLAVWIKCL